MKRTIAILIAVTLGCLWAASEIWAQALAPPAQVGQPATTPPPLLAQPRGAPTASAAAPAQPPAGGFIRAGNGGANATIGFGGGPNAGGGFGGGGFGGNNFGSGFAFGHADDDPEMAKMNDEENEQAQRSNSLMAEYSSTEDYQKRESVKKQLREVLAKQFDVQKQRREHELAKVEERLRKLREQLKKRNDARETIIDRRLESLVSDAEGLGWTPPAAGNAPGPLGVNFRPTPGGRAVIGVGR